MIFLPDEEIREISALKDPLAKHKEKQEASG
jgi:hypothetical protein